MVMTIGDIVSTVRSEPLYIEDVVIFVGIVHDLQYISDAKRGGVFLDFWLHSDIRVQVALIIVAYHLVKFGRLLRVLLCF